jgi:hypothetical protein
MASLSLESTGHASICRRRELKPTPDNFYLDLAGPHMLLFFLESFTKNLQIFNKKFTI